MVGSPYSVDALDNGMIHVPGGLEPDGARFHHATQNSLQFKTTELFISGIFHFIFLDNLHKAKLWIRGEYCIPAYA